jgi:hypothetical protein
VFEEARPHYSTDPIVTYPSNFDRPSADGNVIAPRPKAISNLHPSLPSNSGSPVTTTTTMKPNTHGHAPTTEDSESEVADLLESLDDEPAAVRQLRRVPKPSARMRDSLETLCSDER